MSQRGTPWVRTDPAPWEWKPVCIETDAAPGVDPPASRRLLRLAALPLAFGLWTGHLVLGLALYAAFRNPGIAPHTLLLAALLIGAQLYSGRLTGSAVEARARAIELDDAASINARAGCSTAWVAQRDLLSRRGGRARLLAETGLAPGGRPAPGLSFRPVDQILPPFSLGLLLAAFFAGAALSAWALQHPGLLAGGGKTFFTVTLVSNLSIAAGWTAACLVLGRIAPREIRICGGADDSVEDTSEEREIASVEQESRSRSAGWYAGDPRGVWRLGVQLNLLIFISEILLAEPLPGFFLAALLHGGWTSEMLHAFWALPCLLWFFYRQGYLVYSRAKAGSTGDTVPPAWTAGPYMVRAVRTAPGGCMSVACRRWSGGRSFR